jgi:hypothetical protein
MAKENDIPELSKRLGVVIALLLRAIPKSSDGMSLRDQVQLLTDLGVRPKDIAEILGRTQTYVNKELASLRKGKGKSKKT